MQRILPLFALVAAVTLSGCQPMTTTTAAPSTLNVNATAEVNAIPDRVQVELSVQRMGMDIPTLKSEVDSITAELIEYLRSQNVEDKAIQSYAISIYPRYNYDDGEQKLSGYQVSRRMTVDFAVAEQHGEFIEHALNNGVHNVNEPRFEVSNGDALYQQALTQAVRNARAKAEELATAAGMRVMTVQSIQENSQPQQPEVRYRVAQAADSASVSLPGEQQVQARVNVTFTLAASNE